MKCGLLGKKLGHSYSPQIHSYLGEYSYSLYEKQPEELETFLKQGDFTGLNVTLPYKKDVLPYLSEISDCARNLGAVNTIVRKADGTLVGHNTDYFGFQSLLARTGLSVENKKVLVLGSGGASATAVQVLEESGANVVVISRKGVNNYDNIFLHDDAAVIVNTTPVGMYPNVGVSPIDLHLFPLLEGVIDVVYNPARTQILLNAEKMGIVAANGLWMLVAQAKESAEWFSGQKISDAQIDVIYQRLSLQMKNLILIGMPGCGKSTVGKLLAEASGRRFVDADTIIEESAGCSIPDIFAKFGEDGFRKLETDALASVGMQSNLVIATGGGCVTRPENYPHLYQNGILVWLQRDLELLSTDGRPLSQPGKMEQMYQIRMPLYRNFADIIVENSLTPQQTADEILQQVRKL